MITVDGEEYVVVENLGFVHSIGMYAKVVRTIDGEKTVVGGRGNWRFWTAQDRTQPLRDHYRTPLDKEAAE